MTNSSSFERSVGEWLRAEAPAQAPAEILATALERVAERRQDRYVTQRVFGDRVGSSHTLRFVGLTAVTALLVVALVFSAAIIGGRPTTPLPPPVATPSPAATPVGTPPTSASGAFVFGPELETGRGFHTATRLSDGAVLVLGGETYPGVLVPLADSAEIWAHVSFVRQQPPLETRSQHTATLLPDGRVLVVGGYGSHEALQAGLPSAELWDPETSSFIAAGDLAQARFAHSATLLLDGRVLVAGGYGSNSSDQLDSLEIWDPETSSFSPAGKLTSPRAEHAAFVIPDGRVMFVGQASTEFWSPTTGETTAGPTLVEPRYFHAATQLSDGRVLVTGGVWGSNADIITRDSAEIWDPSTDEFRLVGSLNFPRAGHTSTLLTDGRVLIGGGAEASTFEIWDPDSEVFVPGGPMLGSRSSGSTATLLNDGRVLIVGDMNRQGITRLTEIWDPTAQPLPPGAPTPSPDFTPTPPPVRSGG